MTKKESSPESFPGEIDKGDFMRLRNVERLSWILLALFTLLSLPFRSSRITAGILLGGIIAILNYLWLKNFVTKIIMPGKGKLSRLSAALYLLKYIILGFVIFISIKYDIIHVLSFVLGLMVLLLAILAESIRQTMNLQNEK